MQLLGLRSLRVIQHILPVLILALLLAFDAFAGDHWNFNYTDRAGLLAADWSFNAVTASGSLRNTEQTNGAVISYDQVAHPGVLRIPADEGDMWSGLNNTRNSLFRNLPTNWTSIRLKLSFAPTQNNQQAGLVAYQDDNTYVQITRNYGGGNYVTLVREDQGSPAIVNSVAQAATKGLLLRLDRDAAAEKLTGYYSLDGSNWVSLGSVAQALNNPKMGIVVGASPGGFPNADIQWVEADYSGTSASGTSLAVTTNELVFNVVQGATTSAQQGVNVFHYADGLLSWSAIKSTTWISMAPNYGQTPQTLSVSVNPAGLAPGIYSGAITISASGNAPQVVQITLVVNPQGPVTVSTWKDAKKGALSVSVDDANTSCSSQLSALGLKGTYFSTGTTQDSWWGNLYNSGMELGSHTVSHPCYEIDDATLRYQELEPNINGICSTTPQPRKYLTSLAWPCGYTNLRAGVVASDYFLSARGYNHNQLEETTPSDFMNLKSFNSHEHSPYPPADLKSVVDAAEYEGKWANLVFHSSCNDDNAISYAASKDIWIAPIGTVIKYILQRDRFILDNYSVASTGIKFSFRRLALSPYAEFDFESSFSSADNLTLKVDIEDSKTISAVTLNGSACQYKILEISGNKFLSINAPVLLTSQNVEIAYQEGGSVAPIIGVSASNLQFNTVAGANPGTQVIAISNTGGGTLTYTISGGSTWISASPSAGTSSGESDLITVGCNVTGLSGGIYASTISITDSGASNSPQVIIVTLNINASSTPTISRTPTSLSISTSQGNNAANQSFQVSNSGGGTLTYAITSAPNWLTCAPVSGTSTGELDNINVNYNTSDLSAGTYNGTITIAATGASNSPQTVPVTLTVNSVGGGGGHYDFSYPDRASLLAAGWDFNAMTASGAIRNTEQTTGAVVSYDQVAHPGVLRIPADEGDLWNDLNNTRNTLFKDLPADWTSIRLKLSFAPAQNYQQAGLIAYQNDNTYVQVTRIFENGSYMSFVREGGGVSGTIINSVNQSATQGFVLRLDREVATEILTGYYSLDGAVWTSLGSVMMVLSNPTVGIVVGGSPGGFPNADIHWVEVLAGASPSISRNPASLSTTTAVGINAASQSFQVSNSGGGTLSYTISDDASWLTCSPTIGTSTGELDTIAVSYSTSGLAAGTYTATITVTASGATNTPMTIPVTVTVTGSPVISISPASLSTTTAVGINAASQGFQVSNSGGGTLSYTISDDASWLTCSPTIGTSTGELDTIAVSYSTSGLAAGTYTATITVTASGATNTPKIIPVTVTVTGSPVISISPASLSTTTAVGINAASQSFRVSNSGGGTLSYTISDDASWLTCSPTIGTSTGELDTIAVSYSTSGLAAGTYTATITVTASGATNTPKIIPVTVTVTGSPVISISPASLSTTTAVGINAASQSFRVSNSGGGTLSYTISDDASWLTCSPNIGTSTGELDTIAVNYSTSGLAAGTYTATITVSASGATNTPKTIPVTLTVNASSTPIISVTPATLSTSTIRGNNAASQSFQISNIGGGTLSYKISDSKSWLSCSPISGTSTGEQDTITVTYNASGLAVGTYTATITVAGTGASNTPQTVQVTLRVTRR